MYSLDNIEYLEESLHEFTQILIEYLDDLKNFDNELFLEFCDLYGKLVVLKIRLECEISREYDPKGE